MSAAGRIMEECTGHRFVLEEDGMRWDQVTVLAMHREDGELLARRTVSVGGLVSGPEGALLLRLPGMLEKCWALRPDEARALRDALCARVSEDPRQEPGAA